MFALGIALLIAAPKFTSAPDQPLRVAFLVSDDANLMDLAGAWEVFRDVLVEKPIYVSPFKIYSFLDVDDEKAEMVSPFRLYTVAETRNPIHMAGGLQVTPDYTFDDAPPPHVVVIGAQSGRSPKMIEWIRRQTSHGDVVMSVSTGAFKLAQAGVLKGKRATTQHDFFDALQRANPDVKVQRGARFVRSDEKVFTAGGPAAGIDLALRVVELYFGRETAARTARYMEYEGTGWQQPGG